MSHWETGSPKGLVELAVLATIARGETYGLQSDCLSTFQGLDGLQFTESTIYPVLTRLVWEQLLATRPLALARRAGAAVLSAHHPGENITASVRWRRAGRASPPSLSGLLNSSH